MAKVLFINPVIREEDAPKHIPYGMALLGAIAMKHGHQIQVYDANAHRAGFELLAQVCKADDWEVIAIGGLTTAYGYIKKACRIARKTSPRALIVAGGGFIISMPHEVMQWIPEIDLGIIGEAFLTFPEILKKWDQKEPDFENVLGVCYRRGDGTTQLSQVRPNISHLDDLPYPAWELFPLNIYFENSALRHFDPVLPHHKYDEDPWDTF